jgi:hypothetical protein
MNLQICGSPYWLMFKPVQDFECKEFHLLPTLTLSWTGRRQVVNWGIGIALEFGFWAVILGLAFVPVVGGSK